MPVVRSSDAASATLTTSLAPSNDSALPNLPAAFHVAPAIVPCLPRPDESPSGAPLPSSNPYAATGLTAINRRCSSPSTAHARHRIERLFDPSSDDRPRAELDRCASPMLRRIVLTF